MNKNESKLSLKRMFYQHVASGGLLLLTLVVHQLSLLQNLQNNKHKTDLLRYSGFHQMKYKVMHYIRVSTASVDI
jgi:hypothetical protein